jgi:hypothetical protein
MVLLWVDFSWFFCYYTRKFLIVALIRRIHMRFKNQFWGLVLTTLVATLLWGLSPFVEPLLNHTQLATDSVFDVTFHNVAIGYTLRDASSVNGTRSLGRIMFTSSREGQEFYGDNGIISLQYKAGGWGVTYPKGDLLFYVVFLLVDSLITYLCSQLVIVISVLHKIFRPGSEPNPNWVN